MLLNSTHGKFFISSGLSYHIQEALGVEGRKCHIMMISPIRIICDCNMTSHALFATQVTTLCYVKDK